MANEDSQLKKRTAKGFLWGGIGSGAFQLLNLVFGIFLARLLTPSDYGVIGALTLFSAIAGLLSESGFMLAIVNKRELSDRDLNSVFWFNVVASLALYALLFFLSPLIAIFYHMPEMTPLSRLLFLGFVFGGISTVPTAILYREMKVKQRTQMMLVSVAVSGTVGIICAWHGWGYWGLALQTVVYAGCMAILLWSTCTWRPRFEFDRAALMAMLPFSLKQLATSLFTHINNNFFAMLLARFYGMRPTGFYTQGNKWVTMGYTTLVMTVNGVGQPAFREASDDLERLRRIFRKMLRCVVFLSFPAMLGLGIISPQLITITITDKWLDCVPVMRILCIWGAFMPVSTLYGNLFNAINRPGIYMWTTISLGLLQLLCVVASYPFGLNVMLIVYTAVNILWLLVWQRSAFRCIGLRLRDVLADIVPYFAITVVVIVLTEFCTRGISNDYLALIAKIAMAAALYFFVMWRIDASELREVKDYFLKKKLK